MTARTTAPTVHRPKPWRFPTAEQIVLPNGLRALLYHRPGQHVVTAGLVLNMPLTAEPSSSEGIATVVANALAEGTQPHPGTDFTDAIESCGGVLETVVGYAATQIFLDVPASQLPAGLSLLAEAVAQPTLTDADIDLHRALRLDEVRRQFASPAFLANATLRQTLIRPEFRSARQAGGSLATIATISGDDARAFHRTMIGPSDATLILAGDFETDVLEAVTPLAEWQNPAQRTTHHESPAALPPAATLVHRPDAVQADLRLARFTLDRHDPRWADLQVATRILGGAFNSRLNRALREEKGYTYGVSMATSPMRFGGFSAVHTSVRADALGDTLELLPSLLDVRAQPFTDDEVRHARDYLIGAAPMHYATASGVCQAVATLTAAGLTADFIDASHDALRRVTPDSASEVAAELLAADAATLVVVGDADALAGDVQAAGWDAAVTSVDAVSGPSPSTRP